MTLDLRTRRKPTHQLNTKTLVTQVSSTQAEHLHNLARIRGLSISAYIREVLRTHIPPPLPEDDGT